MANSFFKKKEGKVGLAFIAGAMAVVGINTNPIVHTVREMIVTPEGCVKLFAIVGLAVFAITDKRVRNLISFGFKSIMRTITGWFTELDPMKILKKYVSDLEKSFHELSVNLSKLRQQIAKIKDIMKQNTKEIAKSARLIDEAKRQGRAEVVAVNYNQIGRLNKLNERYALMVGRMEDLQGVLVKMHSYSSYKLNDTKNEIRMREQEYAAISSGYSAMMSAKNIMNGDYQQNEMYEAATEAMTKELHQKIAEMDNFMQLSSPIFEEMDLQRTISQLEGEQMYEKIMSKGQAFLNEVNYDSIQSSYLPNSDKFNN